VDFFGAPMRYTAHAPFIKNLEGEDTRRMSAKAMEDLTATVPADDFHALEEKIYRTIEMLKEAREAKAAAERTAARLRDGRDEQTQALRAEVVALRKEREEVRTRIEKMLKQIDALTQEESGG
jgi:phage-related minor tail protein